MDDERGLPSAQDAEELLESGRPPLPRRIWVAGLALAVIAAGSYVAVRAWPRASHKPAAVAAPSLSDLVQPPFPQIRTLRPWPTAPAACGGDAELPIISSVPALQHTGIRLLVGGSAVRTVVFDERGEDTDLGLSHGRYVSQLVAGPRSYAMVTGCRSASHTQLLRVLPFSAIGTRRVIGHFGERLTSDGTAVWGLTFPSERSPRGSVIPLHGGPQIRLPPGLSPDAITNGTVVGTVPSGSDYGALVLVDARSGRISGHLGDGLAIAVGSGQVVWANCDVTQVRTSCILHRRSFDGRGRVSYRIPRPPGFSEGALSPDSRLLAFTIERARQDPRYVQGHPIPPADIAVLHLDTGALDIVPGIELPAKNAPGLAFSTDSSWLVIALDAGTRTRLLAWRPGMAHPIERQPVPGLVSTPAIAVLPG
jgi:hypothetical protein